MNSPNENIFDVLSEMRTRNFQPEYYQVWINKYADRIEKCVYDLVEEVKASVNQAWYLAFGTMTKEFDRNIRESLSDKFGKGNEHDDGNTQGDDRGNDPAAQ